MPFLFDTNIFLEILLNQDKKEKQKKSWTIILINFSFQTFPFTR